MNNAVFNNDWTYLFKRRSCHFCRLFLFFPSTWNDHELIGISIDHELIIFICNILFSFYFGSCFFSCCWTAGASSGSNAATPRPPSLAFGWGRWVGRREEARAFSLNLGLDFPILYMFNQKRKREREIISIYTIKTPKEDFMSQIMRMCVHILPFIFHSDLSLDNAGLMRHRKQTLFFFLDSSTHAQ